MRISNKVVAATKDEIIHRISEKTGFTLANSKTAFDAVIEVISDVLADHRSVVFRGFGRLEPFIMPQRKMYRINKDGVQKDEDGKPKSFIFPQTTWVKFNMAQSFKYKMNPGIYPNEPIRTDDSD